MPVIAIYESWKPADTITAGLMANCTVSAANRTITGFLLRPVIFAVSLRNMKRNALIIDGDAPVIKEKNPEKPNMSMYLDNTASGECPRKAVPQSNIMYNIPR